MCAVTAFSLTRAAATLAGDELAKAIGLRLTHPPYAHPSGSVVRPRGLRAGAITRYLRPAQRDADGSVELHVQLAAAKGSKSIQVIGFQRSAKLANILSDAKGEDNRHPRVWRGRRKPVVTDAMMRTIHGYGPALRMYNAGSPVLIRRGVSCGQTVLGVEHSTAAEATARRSRQSQRV